MKKVLFCILTVMLLVLCILNVFADEAAGHIYSTDILAFVNGKPIDGYNIGGKTVIIAEDLDGYGFGVQYNDEIRTLKIESYFNRGYKEIEEISRDKAGRIIGNIYKTDIKVYFNGILVNGYNIGGRTAVCIEELGDMSGSANASYGYSDYLGRSIWNPDERTISFESYMRNENEILGISRVYHRFKDNVIYTYPDDFYARSEFSAEEDGEFTGMYTYSPGTGLSRFVIKPLYFDNHGTLTVIGKTVVNPNNSQNEAVMHIENPEAVREMIKTFKTPKMSHDEALAYISQNCKNIKKIENDEFTVLKAEHEMEGLLFVYINKQGGFVAEDFLSAYAVNEQAEIKFWFDESGVNSGKNRVVHSVYPFGGPHGVTTAQFVSDLDEFDYE